MLLALVVVSTTAASAQQADDAPVDLGLYDAPIRFEAPDGVTIELGSGRRLVDTVEVRPGPTDGATVIADMTMQDYVAGVAEMPARWPLEALKAQAVAARTYAWFQMGLGTFAGRGYDICATTACQVFRGREVVETPEVGQFWQQAVDETAGEVLLYAGEPILARYFSTSGGQTRNNEDIFPSSGPRPYLVGVDDPDDAVSPLHRWQAVFTRDQFDALLARGETLSAVSPIADARVDKQPGGVADVVVVTGRDGAEADVTAGELRDFLNTVAPDLYPDDFPGPRSDGNSLPSTVPSSRYEIVVTDTQVVLDGQGWGHGVGMGQYGAMGKAERGLTYDEILAAYYNGLTPETSPAMPERIRVGLADDVDEVSLTADGPVRVTVAGRVIADRALGTWSVAAGPDGTVRLVAPTGYGVPLVMSRTTVDDRHPELDQTVTLETVVNKTTEVTLLVERAGRTLATRDLGILPSGRHRVDWAPEDLLRKPGPYELTLRVVDEAGDEDGAPVVVDVRPTGPFGHARAPVTSVADRVASPALLAGALVLLLVVARIVQRRRR